MVKGRRALISGGGIAGLTLAFWLAEHGDSPVVVERAPKLRRDGYAIDFFGTGFDVAARMGIDQELTSRRVPVDRIVYVDPRGRELAALDVERIRTLLDGKYVPLMHQTLERALYDCVKDRVSIRFGRVIRDIKDDRDGVIATFDNGASEKYDLLVGADGVHSATRALVMGRESAFQRHLGYAIASYRLPDRFGIGRTWTMHNEPGRVVGAYAADEPGSIFAFFLWRTDETTYVPRERRLETLRRVFSDAEWIAKDMLAGADPSADIFMDAIAQIRMPCWHKDRIVFVGDACDCPTLVSGQGASLAMGGAYLLASALRDTPDYQKAFERYEALMRPHVEAQQKSAKGFVKSVVPGSRLAVALQAIVLRVLFSKPFTPLLRQQFAVKSFLPQAE